MRIRAGREESEEIEFETNGLLRRALEVTSMGNFVTLKVKAMPGRETTQFSGDKMKAARNARNMSQADVAKACGLSKRAIENAEAEKNIDIATAQKISHGLQIPREQLELGGEALITKSAPLRIANAPTMPGLLVGRENVLIELRKKLLQIRDANSVNKEMARMIVYGWPGVGKTTIAKAIAHDPGFHEEFPDGLLWASLGQDASIRSQLVAWMQTLGLRSNPQLSDANLASLISGKLIQTKVLLVVDDVFEAHDAMSLLLGGKNCATVLTTRFLSVAEQLSSRPGEQFNLPLLSKEAALQLLRELAPSVVKMCKERCKKLVEEMECLPLSLQVAGRILQSEYSRTGDAFEVLERLIQNQTSILKEPVPADIRSVLGEKANSVTALLKLSTDLLEPKEREYFASLAAFAAKPAIFKEDHLKGIWGVEPRDVLRALQDRGLVEGLGEGRYQVHSLLVTHAKTLCDE